MSHLPRQGRIIINPQYVQIEDRDAPGTYWTMFHDPDEERWGIRDTELSRMQAFNVRRYAAYDEPWCPENPYVRFIVRGGRVGIETRETLEGRALRDRDQAPITTRVGNAKLSLVIQADEWVRPGDVIGYGVLRDG